MLKFLKGMMSAYIGVCIQQRLKVSGYWALLFFSSECASPRERSDDIRVLLVSSSPFLFVEQGGEVFPLH